MIYESLGGLRSFQPARGVQLTGGLSGSVMLVGVNEMNTNVLLAVSFSGAPPIAGSSLALPTFVPASVFGRNAPGNRIAVGLIGMG